MTSSAWRTLLPIARFAGQFWLGKARVTAIGVTLGAFAFALVDVAMQYQLNRWNRTFYDALERRDGAGIQAAAWIFAVLAIGATVTVLTATLFKLLLQIYWRSDVTRRAIAAWLDHQAFYRLTILPGTNFAPEHRIAEDLRLAVEPVVDLTIGFVSSLATVLTFAGVLWTVGGATSIGGITVPGHLVILAFLYAAAVTVLITVFGGTYAQRIRDRSEAEARFRFELTRVRDNAESVALMRGEAGEQVALGAHLAMVVKRWQAYAMDWTKMTWVTYANGIVAPILPLLIMTPKYLSGEVSLGVVMQAATAFGIVQGALGWFTTNFARLSEWYAAVSRSAELLSFIENTRHGGKNASQIEIVIGQDAALRLDQVTVELQDGARVIAGTDLVIQAGEMVLISGDSGAGKSTLVRAIAGLWPWGSGRIVLPNSGPIAFLPQRTYLPTGTLRAALSYPTAVSRISDAELIDALELTGLSHLAPSLDVEQPWDKYLSGGEQQRLGFARLLLHRPAVVMLDEATSALDEHNETRMMELFTHRLFATTVISVAHRPSLARFHNRVVMVHRTSNGSQVRSHETDESIRTRMRRALTAMRGS